MSAITSAPAHLFDGEERLVEKKIMTMVRAIFCKSSQQNSSCLCANCSALEQRRHPRVMWNCPEKNYTVDDIEKIISKTAFLLDAQSHFFLILEKAHTLTNASANKLLKTLEEPPAGYIFILATNNSSCILPTIRSRCILHAIQSQERSNLATINPFLKHFYPALYKHNPSAFEEDLAAQALTEGQAHELLNALLFLFCKSYTEASSESKLSNAHYAQKSIEYIKHAITYLPMPGSALLFWRTFYINFPRFS